MYFVKTPWLLKKMYSRFIWDLPSKEKTIYLTFDDGPHETATPFVLDELKKWNAKATFFCIGKNVVAHPIIYRRILEEGHAVGNHTQNHPNGWKTDDAAYVSDIMKASKHIDSRLFRPPYGRMKKNQFKILNQREAAHPSFSIIMWDVLSGDFDLKVSPQQCLQNVVSKAKSGSLIVFHDSTKAWTRMSFALPKVLEYFSSNGFLFKPVLK